MKRKPHVNYRYHHMGVPTTEHRAGEHYSSTFKMFTSGGEDPGGFRIQFHRSLSVDPRLRVLTLFLILFFSR